MRPSLLALATLLAATIAARCGPGPAPFATVLLDRPVDGALLEDPSHSVAATARVGTNFDAASVEVRLDGVDLLAALGLSPPFVGASGTVLVAGELVTVTGFSFQLTNPRAIALVASGLDFGPHTLEVDALRTSDAALVGDAAAFEVFDPFTLEAEVLAAAGLPAGAASAGSEGFLANATLGQPLAAPPVSVAGGSELRSGFVEVVEAHIAGGSP